MYTKATREYSVFCHETSTLLHQSKCKVNPQYIIDLILFASITLHFDILYISIQNQLIWKTTKTELKMSLNVLDWLLISKLFDVKIVKLIYSNSSIEFMNPISKTAWNTLYNEVIKWKTMLMFRNCLKSMDFLGIKSFDDDNA